MPRCSVLQAPASPPPTLRHPMPDAQNPANPTAPSDHGMAIQCACRARTLATRRILSMAVILQQPPMSSSVRMGSRSSALTASCVSAVAPHSDSFNGDISAATHMSRGPVRGANVSMRVCTCKMCRTG